MARLGLPKRLYMQMQHPKCRAVHPAGQHGPRLAAVFSGGALAGLRRPSAAVCQPTRLPKCSNGPGVTCSSASAPPAGAGANATADSPEIANNCVPLPAFTLPVHASAVSSHGDVLAGAAAAAPAALSSGAVVQPPEASSSILNASQDDIDQYVHNAVEQEMENINQAVHAAFEQEMGTVNQTVQDAVETALLDRSFDVKANLNTIVALTGVILFWRGIWNLCDTWVGTDVTANLGSVAVGLSVMLLFRILKLPLAEFW